VEVEVQLAQLGAGGGVGVAKVLRVGGGPVVLRLVLGYGGHAHRDQRRLSLIDREGCRLSLIDREGCWLSLIDREGCWLSLMN
jgi:hypothetical protein